MSSVSSETPLFFRNADWPLFVRLVSCRNARWALRDRYKAMLPTVAKPESMHVAGGIRGRACADRERSQVLGEQTDPPHRHACVAKGQGTLAAQRPHQRLQLRSERRPRAGGSPQATHVPQEARSVGRKRVPVGPDLRSGPDLPLQGTHQM